MLLPSTLISLTGTEGYMSSMVTIVAFSEVINVLMQQFFVIDVVGDEMHY